MTLYRKYRPQDFDSVVGQEHIKQTLRNAVEKELVSHAYLFTGPRGTGKTSTARILAKVINCDAVTKDHNPCNKCANCEQINGNNLLDIVEIDAASNRGIDEIRELKQTIQFQPSYVKNKVYIIDEVHMLTKEAFNALLKTLEEPPDYVYFVLATTEVDKIPDTIISRCQRFDFRRLNPKVITERLAYICKEEKFKNDEAALTMIAKAADGGMRDAITLLEQLSSLYENLDATSVAGFMGHTEQKLCDDYIDSVMNHDLPGALTIVETMVADGYRLEQVYKDVMALIRERFLTAVSQGASHSIYLDMVEELERNYDLFHGSAIPQLILEATAARICGEDKMPIIQAVPEQVTATVIEKPVAKPKVEVKPKVESAPPEPVAETKPREHQDLKLGMRDLKQNWGRVIDKIESSILRVTLKQAHIKSFANNTIELTFASQFHLDQVNQVSSVTEVERILKTIYNVDLSVKMGLADKATIAKKTAAKPTSDFVESAMDMFEGM